VAGGVSRRIVRLLSGRPSHAPSLEAGKSGIARGPGFAFPSAACFRGISFGGAVGVREDAGNQDLEEMTIVETGLTTVRLFQRIQLYGWVDKADAARRCAGIPDLPTHHRMRMQRPSVEERETFMKPFGQMTRGLPARTVKETQ
jgi:hypothetical protein